MTVRHDLDVAILGAGTAGMAAWRAAAAHTDRVLLIEAARYGTTCARVGCMPSKLLIAAAEAAHAAGHAGRFGVDIGPVRVDGERVMERVRRERDRFVGFVTDTVEGISASQKRLGHARFLDDHTLELGGERVTARAVVIATGSRPRILPMFEGLGDRLVVNDDVFEWTTLPASVAVFGAGAIGLELGQALHRLGVRVRLFGAFGMVGPLTDPGVLADATRIFQAELPFDPDSRGVTLTREEGGARARWTERGREVEDRFEYVLTATGRVPNVDRLGLEHTSLVLDRRGVPVVDPYTLRCGESSIFLAGDASAHRPILHEAADEGRIAGENAARYPDVRPGLRRSPLAVVFSDPQIASVGEPWSRLAALAPVVGRVSFADQGRSRVMGQNRGRLHVYADRHTGRLLGAEMVGPRAEHLAHLLAWAHQAGMTIPQMLTMPFYHPVVEEGLRTALRDADAQLAAREAA